MEVNLVQKHLKIGVLKVFVHSMCLVYLIFWTFRDLSLIPPLAGLAVFKMGQIPSILKKINSNPYEKYILIDTISGILFQSLLIISLSSDFSLLLSGIPIYLSNLVLSCKSYSNSCRFLIFANIAKAIFRWLFIVTFICLALKHENFIEWPWIFVFWPYWLTLFGIGFMCILHVFTMCILKLQGNTSLLCPLWLLYINLGFTVSCSFFFAGFADFLETSSKSSLLLPLLILISYFLLFCTGTLLLLTPLS